jgi:hypothetical protein
MVRNEFQFFDFSIFGLVFEFRTSYFFNLIVSYDIERRTIMALYESYYFEQCTISTSIQIVAELEPCSSRIVFLAGARARARAESKCKKFRISHI